jgi:hypothetical protein
LVTEELRSLESDLAISLGHTPPEESDGQQHYYPQFEQTVRAEAATMAKHYEVFYCLEQSIRKLIGETLQEAEPSGWWESGRVPGDITKAVADLVQKEVDSGVTRRSEDPIDYTTFGQLAVIINTNWDVFATIFTSRRAVEKVMSSLNMLRGPIAHCSPMTEDEVDRLALTVKDWFRIMA